MKIDFTKDELETIIFALTDRKFKVIESGKFWFKTGSTHTKNTINLELKQIEEIFRKIEAADDGKV